MKKLAELVICFSRGEDITIPVKYVEHINISNIQKNIYFFKEETVQNIKDMQNIQEYEVAKEFKIELSKEWLDNNRTEYMDIEQEFKLEFAIRNGEEYIETIENLTYTQRIKKYKDITGITLIYNDGTKRSIEVDYEEGTRTMITEDNVLLNIEIRKKEIK